MHKFLFVLLFQLGCMLVATAQIEYKYQANNPNIPEWVKKMYAEDPNVKDVMAAYAEHYQSHPFEKNQFTQYYKRWLRSTLPYLNKEGFAIKPTQKEKEAMRNAYLARLAQHRQSNKQAANWEELGPWEYDHETTMNVSVQSPGSAHCYTVEQAASDPNTVYAGTASAGIWKSTDKGMNWERIGADLFLSQVYSIEIDFTNPSIMYFGGGDRIWKTSDGGTTFTETGGGQYFDWVRDLRMWPSDNQIIFAATNTGLFRTTDGGNTWDTAMGGEFMEVEFHPTNPSIIYAVKLNGSRTEFYKSTDGGLTFSIRTNGWPGVGTAETATNFNALGLDATGGHIAANMVGLGSAAIQDFSIEMKIKSTGWSGDPSFIGNKNWNSGINPGFILAGRSNGGWKFNIGDANARIDINGPSVDDGLWHHIVLTYDLDGNKTLYQDGLLVGSSSDIISTNVVDPSYALGIGQDGTLTYGEDFLGSISEVRIWNKVLDRATIENYQCKEVDNTHPDYSSLLHYYKLNEGTGSLANDLIGGNNGTISGTTTWNSNNEMTCIISEMAAGDEQKRVEMSVSAAAADNIYILATGATNGGSGLYGFYKSTDMGESFTFTCCGPQPGGPATATNPNIMGWNFEDEADGGQYYYDVGLGVSPTDPDRIFPAGISMHRSVDGGASFTTNGHWVTWVGENTKKRYTHADVHDIKFFENGANIDMWIASDGGLYYSADQGDSISPRMYGIQGTEFWGFGSSYKDDAMVGGTYHNGTLLSFRHTFPKGKNGHGGWLASGAGDATRGYIHPADPSIMFEDGGMWQVQGPGMNWKRLSFDNSKRANASAQPGLYGNYEWDPRCHNTFYSPSDSMLWKTEDNGSSFNLVHNFGTGKIYTVKISRENPSVIYVVHDDEPVDITRIWKSTDAGLNWSDITPSDAQVNNLNYKNKVIEIDQADENHLWFIITGWYGHTGNKVFETTDGGTTWTDITGTTLENERVYDIAYHQGSDGGLYVGSNKAVYYKNNSMADWQLYNDGLPASIFAGYLHPNYAKQKIRLGTRSGAYQSDFFENAPPVAKPSANKIKVYCTRDTVQFKELSYISNENPQFLWQFPGGNPSSSTEANPKVVYGTEGAYNVMLTVTDDYGTDSHEFIEMITVENNCQVDTIPGLAVELTNPGDFVEMPSLSLKTNEITFSAWIKPNGIQDEYGGIVFSKEESAGLNFRANNELAYHWPGGQWWWSSGLFVPENEWSHVAMVVSPDSLTVFLNGERSTHYISPDSVDFKEILIGSYKEWDSRNYRGLIDEVCIWDKSLTQEDIRDLRHLTKEPLEDPALMTYFQFNAVGGEIMDKIGIRHGKFRGGAGRTISTTPVGGGESYRMAVNSGGSKAFLGTGVTLDFPATGTYPDGEIVVTRINLEPDEMPVTQQYSRSYWVINNYGLNSTFTSLDAIAFQKIGEVVPADVAAPTSFKLYKRDSNNDGTTWASSIDDGDLAVSGSDGHVTFSTGNPITSFSQFLITNEGGNSLPLELLDFTAEAEGENVRLNWTTSAEINTNSFTVQRSKTGTNFRDVKTLAAQGGAFETQYSTLDEAPFSGLSYYRLKILDRGGAIAYSPIVAVEFFEAQAEIFIYPNPVAKGRVFNVESNISETLVVSLYDATGKFIKEKVIEGKGEVSLEGFASGVYMCNVKGRNYMRNVRVVVQ